MQPYFGFVTPETERQRKKDQVYKISQKVAQFFWDDAPGKFGFENREGQREMAFEILDSIKDQRHIVIDKMTIRLIQVNDSRAYEKVA